ncbi:hypothetical protein M427DRAFT_143454 [Gonapodya prolifera JEL478]|uniref:Methyltransferase domain-containing protein n=1 Tax=Gonapodya prolifera (strain JEL478) TaxID=1344416 RepID=A0A139AR82_GONPJ|nr:hypothetical protein M427DRAFT_143454 [Gonapodya prolifera JEL478]|eukprot:KXS19246.1 hypothetical protein M427DRAFT_143454 [Gonapodya prolifera JEL478]
MAYKVQPATNHKTRRSTETQRENGHSSQHTLNPSIESSESQPSSIGERSNKLRPRHLPKSIFRPSGISRALDQQNKGPSRQPEPFERPPEGPDSVRTNIETGQAASQADLGNAPPCVMYGFGVDWDFTWEDEFWERTGCETHSFDPSLSMESHYRGRNQWFWSVGIAATSAVIEGTTLRTHEVSNWPVRTLSDVMRALNHTHISVLKMDVEGFEWDALARAFHDGVMDNVEQVLLEVHVFKEHYRKWTPPESAEKQSPIVVSKQTPGSDGSDLDADVAAIRGWIEIMDLFERSGFVQYYHHTNPMSVLVQWTDSKDLSNLPCCFEIAWLRAR